MMASHLPGNRNSTPEASGSSLRLPSSRAVAGHALRQSADAGAFSSSRVNPIRPASEVIGGSQGQGHTNNDDMDKAAQQWIADIDQYEATLEEMAAATLDQDFKDELSAIEQWFRVLSEAERTAALYALLQQTTQVQIRFFIQVLQQMAKSHPVTGMLSPANFDPMSQKMTDAMGKLNVDGGSRNSLGFGTRPPPSPGKRTSGLDQAAINTMFPDAVAAIAKQKADFTQQTGMAPTSNRNSTVTIDRSSLVAPTISAPEDLRKESSLQQPPASPWGPRAVDAQQPIARPKSSQGQQQPMGQFSAQPPPSAGLRSPRPNLANDGNIQSTTLTAGTVDPASMPMLSPYQPSGGNWASMVNTPAVANFNTQQSTTQADMIANATAMKLAALSTVNNRIQLDDVRKYRRARSTEGQGGAPSAGLAGQAGAIPTANIVMTNEHGQFLTPQQAAALQAQQLAVIQGHRSRPNSPGVLVTGASGVPAMPFTAPQNNGFLAAYDQNGLLNPNLAGLNLSQFGLGGGMGSHDGYLSDHSGIHERGRSPRGRRGSSKPPEDPTDPRLLEDIPNWLRSLRLHKYTDNLKDIPWQELVEMDDDALEKRGVNALGARRKMLKVFEQIRDARQDGKL